MMSSASSESTLAALRPVATPVAFVMNGRARGSFAAVGPAW